MKSSFRQKIQVRRISGGHIARGRLAGQTETKIMIMASVQPATGKDMQAMEDGRRNRAAWVLFTDTQLNTVGTQNPDRVLIMGDDCEVVTCEPWQNNVANHFRAIVQKMAETSGAPYA